MTLWVQVMDNLSYDVSDDLCVFDKVYPRPIRLLHVGGPRPLDSMISGSHFFFLALPWPPGVFLAPPVSCT